MPVEVVVPRLGLTQTDGTLVRWLKHEGDTVAKGEPILELMTDKATVEVEAPASGVLFRILHKEDEVVPIGEAVALISPPGEETVPASKSVEGMKPLPKVTPVARRVAEEHGIDLTGVKGTGEGGAVTKEDVLARMSTAATARKAGVEEPIRASPAARRVARELGVDLSAVQGTGPDGRITEQDVRDALASQAEIVVEPEVRPVEPPRSPAGPVPVVSSEPLRGIRQIAAERMTLSFQTTPHFYLTIELDATNLLDLRERLQKASPAGETTKITITDLLVKLVAAALSEHTYANASWQDGAIQLLGEVNIGVATATENGLVVTVIRGADHQSFRAIARAREELTARAREGKLSVKDVSGGTFTISNLGMYDVDLFAGIINPPQSALLAVGKIKERPCAVDGQVKLRPIFYVTLSVDHRVMDGAQAALFLQRVAALVEQPALLVA
jgi:pyruvate dehydrogenase E2 component (dihydrolipoamide acetyltransferase)